MQVGDKVKVNWKRVYPKMSGEIISMDESIATVKTNLGEIDFPLTSLKKS